MSFTGFSRSSHFPRPRHKANTKFGLRCQISTPLPATTFSSSCLLLFTGTVSHRVDPILLSETSAAMRTLIHQLVVTIRWLPLCACQLDNRKAMLSRDCLKTPVWRSLAVFLQRLLSKKKMRLPVFCDLESESGRLSLLLPSISQTIHITKI